MCFNDLDFVLVVQTHYNLLDVLMVWYSIFVLLLRFVFVVVLMRCCWLSIVVGFLKNRERHFLIADNFVHLVHSAFCYQIFWLFLFCVFVSLCGYVCVSLSFSVSLDVFGCLYFICHSFPYLSIK